MAERRRRPLTGSGDDVLLAVIADALGVDPEQRPTTFWPGDRRVAQVLRDAHLDAPLPTDVYEDADGEARDRWHDRWTDDAADPTDVVLALSVYIGFGHVGDGAVDLYARPTPRGIEWACVWEGDEEPATPRYTAAPVDLETAHRMLADWLPTDLDEAIADDEDLEHRVMSDWYGADERLDAAAAHLRRGDVPPDWIGRLAILPGDLGAVGDPQPEGPDLRIEAEPLELPLAELLAGRDAAPLLVRREGALSIPGIRRAVPHHDLHRTASSTRELVAWVDPGGRRRLLEIAGTTRTAWVLEREGEDAVLAAYAARGRSSAGRARVLGRAGGGSGTPLIGPWSARIRCADDAVRAALRAGVRGLRAEGAPWRKRWLDGLQSREDLVPAPAPVEHPPYPEPEEGMTTTPRPRVIGSPSAMAARLRYHRELHAHPEYARRYAAWERATAKAQRQEARLLERRDADLVEAYARSIG